MLGLSNPYVAAFLLASYTGTIAGVAEMSAKDKVNKESRNILAVGDNLVALKGLAAKKCLFDFIYIDPPYNTGNKFSYLDNREKQQYLEFILSRLKLAQKVLSQDGLIYISIDDNAYVQVRLACDQAFGANNFVGTFITRQATRSNTKLINTIHEYIVVYAKDIHKTSRLRIKRVLNPESRETITNLDKLVKRIFGESGRDAAESALRSYVRTHSDSAHSWLRNYNCVDNNGDILFPKDLSVPGEPAPLDIDEINLHLDALPTRRWSSKKKFINLYKNGKLYFKNGRPYEAHYLVDSYDNVSSILNFYSRQGTNDLAKLGLRGLFDTPKPVEMIKYLIRISLNEKPYAKVLDFFAGSGTTGQAVMEVNKEDGTHRSFLLVQLDEPIQRSDKSFDYCTKNNVEKTIDQLTKIRLDTYIKQSHSNESFLTIRAEDAR